MTDISSSSAWGGWGGWRLLSYSAWKLAPKSADVGSGKPLKMSTLPIAHSKMQFRCTSSLNFEEKITVREKALGRQAKYVTGAIMA